MKSKIDYSWVALIALFLFMCSIGLFGSMCDEHQFNKERRTIRQDMKDHPEKWESCKKPLHKWVGVMAGIHIECCPGFKVDSELTNCEPDPFYLKNDGR